jgi:hypothetical protein
LAIRSVHTRIDRESPHTILNREGSREVEVFSILMGVPKLTCEDRRWSLTFRSFEREKAVDSQVCRFPILEC